MSYLKYPVAEDRPVRIGLIGAGWIGNFHAESVAFRIPNARLEAIADPAFPAVEALAGRLGVARISADPADVINDPDIDAVLIAAPARFHSGSDRGRGAGRKACILREARRAHGGRT
ncbi:hypothetical protein QFZ40_002156 [Arthrobacter pascens]|nr:hypothetical protein [Arthrobacter pascens]